MEQLRVLVLDDDPMVGMLIESVALTMGAQVHVTERPGPFFEALPSWQPNRIVLDIQMPEMNGVQVLDMLAARGCRVPIVLTSGSAGDAEDARCGCDASLVVSGVLGKPFRAEQLRALLVKD